MSITKQPNNTIIYTHLLGPGKGSFFLPAGIAKVTRKSITIACLIPFSFLSFSCILQTIPLQTGKEQVFPPPGHKNKLFKSDWGVGEGFRLFFPNFTLLTKVIKLFCCWLWPKSQKIENFLYKPFSSSFSRFSAVKTLSAWKEKTFTSLLTT